MITSKKDANRLINACVNSHQIAWDSARDSEDYVMRMRPPLPKEELEAKAIWAHNYNYGKGRCEVKKTVKENITEIARSISLVEVEFPKFDKKKHNNKLMNFLQVPELREMVEERIAYTFGEFVESDQSFSLFVSKAEYMNLMFGYASVVGDNASYVPEVIHFCDIGFDDHTCLDDVQKFVLFSVKKASYYFDKLLSIVNNDDLELLDECDNSYITKSGWNKDALVNLVCDVFNLKEDHAPINCLRDIKNITDKQVEVKYESWEDIALINERMGYSWCVTNLNNITIAKCYEILKDCVVEAHAYLPNSQSRNNRGTYDSIRDILYVKEHPKSYQDDLLNLVYDFSVDGSSFIHDISGASRIISEHSQRYDIKTNALEDSMFLSGLTWLESNVSGGIQNVGESIVIAGGIAVMTDQGLTPVQFKQRVDNTDLAMSVQQEDKIFQDSFGNYRANTRMSNRPTKDEVNFINNEAYNQRSSDIPFKLKAYSKIITNAFKKLASDKFLSYNLESQQKRFVEMLEEEFSDMDLKKDEIIKLIGEVKRVKITPVLADREAISNAMGFAGTASARKRLTRMMLLSYGFTSRQIRSMIDMEEYGVDASIVAFENVTFETSSEVAFSVGQDHLLHLNGHFYKFDRKIKGVSEGEDPVVAFNTLRNGLLNTAQHIRALSMNVFYRNSIKDYEKYQKMFENDLKELGQMLDQARQQQQQNGGEMNISPELRQKLQENEIKLREKLRTQQIRTQAAQEQRIEQQKFNQALQQDKANFDKQLKQQKTQSEVDATLAKAAAEIAKR